MSIRTMQISSRLTQKLTLKLEQLLFAWPVF
jgi:hypothetical protein